MILAFGVGKVWILDYTNQSRYKLQMFKSNIYSEAAILTDNVILVLIIFYLISKYLSEAFFCKIDLYKKRIITYYNILSISQGGRGHSDCS